MKKTMQKVTVLFVLLLCATSAALADTIYLKNGREVQGTFTGFENGQFTITDIDGNLLKFRIDRVERLVIDRDTRRGVGRDEDYRGDREGSTLSGSSRSGRWESVDAFDVRPENAWVQSPIQVYSGQRVRVEASGTVMLDGRTNVTADGWNGQRHPYAPMPYKNVGALIARIGRGFDSPPVYIGRSSEFVADRDGALYLAVNHPAPRNSRGAFLVNVSVDRSTGGFRDDRSASWPGTGPVREKTVTVNGNQSWTDTGIDLQPNMTVEIIAEGQITYDGRVYVGPNGDRSVNYDTYPVKNAGVGAVIAQVRYRDGRSTNPIFIGARNQMNTGQTKDGRLFIGVNDDQVGDNTGSYRVTIRW